MGFCIFPYIIGICAHLNSLLDYELLRVKAHILHIYLLFPRTVKRMSGQQLGISTAG